MWKQKHDTILFTGCPRSTKTPKYVRNYWKISNGLEMYEEFLEALIRKV